VRRKFTRPGRAGATYIDLFCGPGRAHIRDTEEIIDGSPLVAVAEARCVGAPFTQILLGDVNPQYCAAVAARLHARDVEAAVFEGKAEDSVLRIAEQLNPHALHFAFLDPYNLEALPFSVIERLAQFKHMDILIHVSAMDLQRNLKQYLESAHCPLDLFAPGWRAAVDRRRRDESNRRSILDYWLHKVRELDMSPAQAIELVTGSRRQPLYWLVFVARHPLAGEFWEKIRDISPQRPLFS
jgi:three-Cys-motif partner protein